MFGYLSYFKGVYKMYTVGKQKFIGDKSENILNQIQTHLYQNQLVITDNKGTPLEENEILNIISTHSTYCFNTTSISDIENGFISEIIDYIKKVENHFTQLSMSNDNGHIINIFIDLINSLIEIESTVGYFGIDFLNVEQIKEIANKALSRIEKGDIEYILDLMEYEIIPTLLNFESKLLERQYQ